MVLHHTADQQHYIQCDCLCARLPLLCRHFSLPLLGALTARISNSFIANVSIFKSMRKAQQKKKQGTTPATTGTIGSDVLTMCARMRTYVCASTIFEGRTLRSWSKKLPFAPTTTHTAGNSSFHKSSEACSYRQPCSSLRNPCRTLELSTL